MNSGDAGDAESMCGSTSWPWVRERFPCANRCSFTCMCRRRFTG